jgi:Putative esterase
VWADVARRYRLDPPRTTIAGYSMGGFGTFTLADQFPDLFARAQPTVGTAVPTSGLASLRWVPVLMWNTTTDELVPPAVYRPAADALRSLGYRYELDAFAPFPPLPVPTPNHLGLAVNDQFAPAARFLGAARVVRDPPRVTYVRNPALEFPRVGLDSDHAYWLLGIRLRNGGATGTIDVRSRGFGVGDAPARRSTGSGTLTGGNLGPRPFAVERTTWGSAPRTAVRDELEVRASNVRSLTIDTVRARVSCGARVRVLSGGPVVVRLRGCPQLRARPILTG